MDINVKLIQVFPVQTITSRDGSKSWQKQEFLTETIDNSQYPRKICFTLFGDNRVGIVDQYQPNTLINVSFDLQSRESNGRWFSNCLSLIDSAWEHPVIMIPPISKAASLFIPDRKHRRMPFASFPNQIDFAAIPRESCDTVLARSSVSRRSFLLHPLYRIAPESTMSPPFCSSPLRFTISLIFSMQH